MQLEVTVCRTGMAKHAPDLQARAEGRGARVTAIDCFDKCETCERCLLVRIDGAMLRCQNLDELLEAIDALATA